MSAGPVDPPADDVDDDLDDVDGDDDVVSCQQDQSTPQQMMFMIILMMLMKMMMLFCVSRTGRPPSRWLASTGGRVTQQLFGDDDASLNHRMMIIDHPNDKALIAIL